MKNSIQTEYEIRIEKLKKLKKLGIDCYPERYQKTHSIHSALRVPTGTQNISLAGRIVSKRTMGKITFCHILDETGKMQMVFQENRIQKNAYDTLDTLIDIGDFIGVQGELGKTKKGEISILVDQYTFLGKALRPLPEKWHGLKDTEIRYRQRYLDLITNKDVKDIFVFRHKFLQLIREFYWRQGFIEVETPTLANTASGAIAKPFTTHHNALGINLYLRISAGELWQKMAIIGGFEKIFEIGKVFRNEGIDPSHLQEFTMIEHYVAYWNFEDNMKFTENLFTTLLQKLLGTLSIKIKNPEGKIQEVDFTPPWSKISYHDVILKDSGIDIEAYQTSEKLRAVIKKKKLFTSDMNTLGLGNLIDVLYKTVSRGHIIGPAFLLHHPIDVSPLARKNTIRPNVVDRFQLIVNGWEVVNAYSELVDPREQEKRFSEQMKAKALGDTEAHGEDKDFITALEHGAPPISGWGMGIDRVIALLTSQDNLRDVILFPLLRPEK